MDVVKYVTHTKLGQQEQMLICCEEQRDEVNFLAPQDLYIEIV